ncbi:unnamed protein product, partial [Lymnaea stagnalis]
IPFKEENIIEQDFFKAAKTNTVPTLKYLYQANDFLKNIKDEDGNTALMIAAENGHINVTKFLFENGEDINIENKNGMTALQLAQKNKHFKIVTLLEKP